MGRINGLIMLSYLIVFMLVVSDLSSMAYAADDGWTDENFPEESSPVRNDTGATEYAPYTIVDGFFSCEIPSAWVVQRDEDEDERYRIYEIELIAPESDQESVVVYVSYYADNNLDFSDYKDFINRNSKNVLGETKNRRENYSPVKETSMSGRDAFELTRERMVFLHPEGKADDSVQLEEKMYVLPAKEGFYVLHFRSPGTLFSKYSPVFEHICKTFKGRF